MRNLVANVLDLAAAAAGEVLHHTARPVMTTSTITARCLAAGRTHPAAYPDGQPTGHRLCPHHFDELAQWVRDVQEEARDLDPHPQAAIVYDEHTGGSSSIASQQSPVRMEAVALSDHRLGTDSALAVLHYWADRVRTGRGLTEPRETVTYRVDSKWAGPVCAGHCAHESCLWLAVRMDLPFRPTIATERAVITRHLEWLCSQPSAGKFYAAIDRLRIRLRAANGQHEPKPLPGSCPAIRAGKECGGPLWPDKPEHTVGEWSASSPAAVQCKACKARWEGPSALARLALIVERQKKDVGR